MSKKLNEKVIKGLEYCIDYMQRVVDAINEVPCNGCPYVALKPNAAGQGDCIDTLFKDALTVLKAQEPATVIQISCTKTQMSGVCPSCMMPITSPKLGSIHVTTHCQFCGKAVKWDDD